ncbi:TcpQ domain-containing protein [Burkholderia gladioli]|uniref:TcpQ domain-containing protein n=1 Tax=Burkholderia gladioli TaxID=28095 RepID=UPI00163ED12A|nr:TcpQ domain-containing protein [Burkholderia gladioli]
MKKTSIRSGLRRVGTSASVACIALLSACANNHELPSPFTQANGPWRPVCSRPATVTSAPIPSTPVSVGQVGAQLSAPGFDLKAADQNLATSLQRWAKASDVTVRWDSQLVVPVPGDSHIAGDFPIAMRTIKTAMKESGYPLTMIEVVGEKTWIVLDSSTVADANSLSKALNHDDAR